MTVENDVVLIYLEGDPVSFARVEEISADAKPDWYHVKLLMLQVPLQTVTWILRDSYISGETFTMGGKQMRIEKVVCPEDEEPDKPDKKNESPEISGSGKVISLADLKKK